MSKNDQILLNELLRQQADEFQESFTEKVSFSNFIQQFRYSKSTSLATMRLRLELLVKVWMEALTPFYIRQR